MASVFITVIWILAALSTAVVFLALLAQAGRNNNEMNPMHVGVGLVLACSLVYGLAAAVVAALIHIALAVAIAVFDIKDDIALMRARGDSGNRPAPVIHPSLPVTPSNPPAPVSIEEQDRQQLARIRGRG
jgi:hypothetical protein